MGNPSGLHGNPYSNPYGPYGNPFAQEPPELRGAPVSRAQAHSIFVAFWEFSKVQGSFEGIYKGSFKGSKKDL